MGRARGDNFTGLEVAHIFPLMGVAEVSTSDIASQNHLSSPMQLDWMATLPESTHAQVLHRQVADRPHNAILLRADVHSLFDDYQWSIWVCTMLVLPYVLLF